MVHERFMMRCLELAKSGAGWVAPNPMVGAVLVHDDRIIGEGFHQQFGQAHAEVNCIASVHGTDRELIGRSTLYVSLEPCAHFGKTPPCADLIIRSGIVRCVIGTRDPFNQVDGRGIEKLRNAGVDVVTGMLENEAVELNRRFFTVHTKRRPYIILKWAQSADGMIASATRDRLLISNEYSNRLVHRWRTEEASILVGTNTALLDDPSLTARLWPGKSPARLVVDMELKLPSHLKVFDDEARTVIFNAVRHDEQSAPAYFRLTHDSDIVQQVCNALYQMNIQSVIVEGGAKLLQSFIDAGLWDEARVISNRRLFVRDSLQGGIPAPIITHAKETEVMELSNDTIRFFKPAS